MPAYMNWSIVFLKHSPWPISLLLTGELIWDAFFLYSLICDSHDKSNILVLSDSTHPDHLYEVLKAYNAAMVGLR